MSVYEKLMPSKRIHYVPYWIAVGAILFLQQEVIARACGETDELLGLRLLIAFYVSMLAIVIYSLLHFFLEMMDKLEDIVELPTSNSRDWIAQKVQEFFTFDTLTVRIYILVLMVSFTITVLWLGTPYRSAISNADLILTLQPFLVVSAHAIYGIASLLRFLSQLVSYPIKTEISFYQSKHPTAMLLSSFYARLSSYALIVVFWLGLAVWQNPYGFVPLLVAWLLFVSFLPLAGFIWTFSQVHALMQRFKRENIKISNNLVRAALRIAQDESSTDSADTLTKFMGIQKMVEKMPEWPIAVREVTTLTITVAFPVVNIGLSILGAFD